MTLIDALNEIMCFFGWVTFFILILAIIVSCLLNRFDGRK